MSPSPTSAQRPLLPPPPPPKRPSDATPAAPLRERLPEVAAGIGLLLVAIATAGLVRTSWETVGHEMRAVLLGAAAAGLTAAALWAERSTRRGMATVTSLVLAAASALVAGAVTLGLAATLPGHGRIVVAVGGIAALAHAAAFLARRRDAAAQAVAVWAATVYAAGPFGRSLGDRFGDNLVDGLVVPVAGFLDPTISSEVHLVTAAAHLVVGALALAALPHLFGPARHAMRVLAIATVAFAALEMNVLASPVGAVTALGIVIGFLLHGLATDDGVVLVAASTAALAAGVRVLLAVFSGEVVATMLLLLGGLALLGWAVRAMHERPGTDRAT